MRLNPATLSRSLYMKRQCLCLIWLALVLPCLPLQAHDALQTSFQSYDGLNALGDVRDVAVQSTGGMWLLDNQGDIYFFDGHQSHPLKDVLNVPDEKILTIAYAHQSLWMAGQHGIYRFQPGTIPSYATRCHKQDKGWIHH